MGLLNLRLDPIPQLGLQTNEITEQSDNIETHQRTLPQLDSVESTLPRNRPTPPEPTQGAALGNG